MAKQPRPTAQDYENLVTDPTAGTTTPPAAHQVEQAAADNADLDEGRIVSQGVGLRQGEIQALQDIADRLGGKEQGVTLNALMRIAIRHFITAVRAGQIDPGAFFEEPPKPKKRARYS